jgi:uncharacterized protein YbjT (DUF2867 family)
MPVKPILVVGATGLLGCEICRKLSDHNLPHRALVRPGADLSVLEALIDGGAEIILGDVSDPGCLHNACEGICTVISNLSLDVSRIPGDCIEILDPEGEENLIDAALEAAVDSFIYISLFQSPYKFPLQDVKHKIEKQLQRTCMRYTILRPSFFMDLWLSPTMGFDTANRKVTFYGPGSNKISYIAAKDIARFAIASLFTPAAWNKVIDLGGPEALSLLEVVRLFEEESGESFALNYIPEEVLQQQLMNAPTEFEKSIAGLKLTYANGAEVPMERTLSAFNMELQTVTGYLKTLTSKQKDLVIEQI